jgi:hypothetical protein
VSRLSVRVALIYKGVRAVLVRSATSGVPLPLRQIAWPSVVIGWSTVHGPAIPSARISQNVRTSPPNNHGPYPNRL